MRAHAGTVLVADPDAPVRTMLQNLLRDAGYQVLVCANPAECYDVIRAARPQLAIIDVSGRSRDGFWLALLQLYADSVTRRIPLVLMTTNTPWLDDAREVLDAMGVRALPKPFDTAEVLNTIAASLRREARRGPSASPLTATPSPSLSLT